MSKPIDQELLPCPFCGGVPIVSSFPGLNKIYCSNQPVKCGNRSMFTRGEWQARSAVQPAGVAVPDMPPTQDRRPYDDEEPDGYLEGNNDWAENNNDAVEWLADNHAAIRLALAAAPHPVSGEQTVDQHNVAYWQEQYELLRKDYQRTLDEARVAIPEGFMVLPIKPTPAMKAACRVAGKTQVWADMVAAHRAQQGEQSS